MPVGSYPFGQSPYGARDMAGNVREWVQPRHDNDVYQRTRWRRTQNFVTGTNYLLRGGSWNDPPWDARSSRRLQSAPATRNTYSGFRCAG